MLQQRFMVQPATLWLRGVRLRPQSHKDTTRTFVIHLDHRSRTWTCLRRLEAKFRMSNTKSKHLWSEELEGMESFSSMFLDVVVFCWGHRDCRGSNLSGDEDSRTPFRLESRETLTLWVRLKEIQPEHAAHKWTRWMERMEKRGGEQIRRIKKRRERSV